METPEAMRKRIDNIGQSIAQQGLANFSADRLKDSDLESMSWSGDALHIEIVRKQLQDQNFRAETLAIFTPDRLPVSKGYVIYDLDIKEATISQLATHPRLQSLGLGTMLLDALESLVRKLGVRRSILGVEKTNVRARKLYEKLGYQYFKSDVDSWEATHPNGDTYTHHTEVDWLTKQL